MLSLNKLLVLVAIILAVWYGMKLIARLQANAASPPARPKRSRVTAEDLVKCRVCGVYVSAGAPGACARSDCPHPRLTGP